MSIGIFEFIWNRSQDRKIRTLERVSRGADASSENLRGMISDLEERIERLSLICEGMWTLLRDRTEISEEDLKETVTRLDMEDGVLDGKRGPKKTRCPDCDAVISNKFNRCLYCGYRMPADDRGAFGAV